MSEVGEGKEKCSPGNGVQLWACGSGSRSLDEKSASAAEVNGGDRGALFPSRCSAALAPSSALCSSGSGLLGKDGLCPVPVYPHVAKKSTAVCV